MKFLLACFLFIPLSGYSLCGGNPDLPRMPRENLWLQSDGPISLKVNYLGDFLSSRRVKASSIENPKVSSQLHGGEFSFGILDRVELYTLLGGFSTKVEGKNFSISSEASFGGEVGIRALAAFWGELKLGIDGKYFYGWPGTDSPVSMQKEWQISVAFSQTFAFLSPYVGVKCAKFSLAFIDEPSVGETVQVENVSPFGVFIGVGMSGKKGAFFNIEGRFLDETALALTLGLRF